jgi:Ca2+-binding RTX toxin-like protein
MIPFHIAADLQQAYIFTTANSEIFLDEDVTITASDYGIAQGSAAEQSEIHLNGTIIADDVDGIGVWADDGVNLTVTLSETGGIFADQGIRSDCAITSITNAGYIHAGAEGIYSSQSLQFNLVNTGTIVARDTAISTSISGLNTVNHIENSGLISGHTIVYAYTDNFSLKQSATGEMRSQDGAIYLGGNSGDVSRIENAGLIVSASHFAVVSGDSRDTVINSGHIIGALVLGGSADVFRDLGGTVKGAIKGGLGDDLFVLAGSDFNIVEVASAGRDTIRSSVSFVLNDSEIEVLTLTGKTAANATGNAYGNEITGNAIANRLRGMAGEDILSGGLGNDRLTGGADADTFVFARSGGRDIITDFTDGTDIIDLTAYGKKLDHFAELKPFIHDTGADVSIDLTSFKDGGVIILKGVDAALIGSADFLQI